MEGEPERERRRCAEIGRRRAELGRKTLDRRPVAAGRGEARANEAAPGDRLENGVDLAEARTEDGDQADA
jgi:hypothetical protein